MKRFNFTAGVLCTARFNNNLLNNYRMKRAVVALGVADIADLQHCALKLPVGGLESSSASTHPPDLSARGREKYRLILARDMLLYCSRSRRQDLRQAALHSPIIFGQHVSPTQ